MQFTLGDKREVHLLNESVLPVTRKERRGEGKSSISPRIKYGHATHYSICPYTNNLYFYITSWLCEICLMQQAWPCKMIYHILFKQTTKNAICFSFTSSEKKSCLNEWMNEWMNYLLFEERLPNICVYPCNFSINLLQSIIFIWQDFSF